MKQQSFNDWQKHIAKELEKNYRKLKLIKNANIRTVPRQKPADLRRV
jgi:hypothetical protein